MPDQAKRPLPSDTFERPLRNLRVSVTDRCNLRCSYCMPEENYRWLERDELLSFEELAQLVDAFVELGVDRVRLTGGEPLLRRDLHVLVAQLRRRPGLREIALTTNGLKLADQAPGLRSAGLDRVTISIDSLRPDRYKRMTRRDGLAQALAGVDAAVAAGFRSVKLNTVVIRGHNDDELGEIVDFARGRGVEPRFIEYMDVGGATHWSPGDVFSRAEILRRLGELFGGCEPVAGDPSAPADRYRIPDGTIVGVISSTTAPFCARCDRARLTADGHWYTCLYARKGRDLRAVLRDGASHAQLVELLRGAWSGRDDRGAEERLALARRTALADAVELQRDPHLEMHTRGG